MNGRLAVAALIAALALACGACAGTRAPRRTPSALTPAPSATARTPSAAAPSGTATMRPEATASPFPTARSGDSGVEGIVLAGPTCPLERIDSPCPDRPVSLTLGFYTPTHSTPAIPVATATSGADGRFRVALPPGTYIVQRACGPQNCTQFPSVKPVMVEVQADRYTNLTVSADTGIR